MTVKKIYNLAEKHGVRLGSFGKRGRGCITDQPEIDKRNLFLLAIYEESQKTPNPLTIQDIANLANVAHLTASRALDRGRMFRNRFNTLMKFKEEINQLKDVTKITQ